ncbi:VENN motif pre-toxin domain-containing protein [Siccibacter colletis]|nr:VENN motif pre-toxin domain-containing protein [Siccibacter colletis]WNN48564.1 VENN motif pre-toxin domain-containing protein [Siccibacter colletis]
MLTESEKETVSALAILASGLAGGLVGDSTQSAAYAAQTGKTTVENNALNGGWGNLLPPQTMDYGQAQVSLVTNTNLTDESGKVLNPATEEQIRYASDKLVTGTLPDGANITKVIVEGYTDGVLIAGAWYLGPAASVGKVVGGATLAEIANGSYQWFDMSRPGNENKTWDYWGSTSAAITGALAPGRSVTQNVGIAAGGALFTDGPDAKAIGSAAAGAWAGGLFGEYAPGFVNSITGKEIPGLVYDFWGGVSSEYVSGFIKDYGKPQSETKDENK